MIHRVYEHHKGISTNHTHPFLLRHIADATASAYNWHKNIELLLITDGEGAVQYGQAVYPLQTGELVVFNSDAMHYIYSQTSISYYYIILDRVFCSDNGIDVEKIRFLEKPTDPAVTAAFRALIDEWESAQRQPEFLSVAKLRRAALSLLIALCSESICSISEREVRKNASEELVKAAMLYLNENYTRPIHLDDLAEQLNVSKPHLARTFKKYTGETLITYVNTLRCRQAAVGIASGMSVTQAALESGFETLSYFSRTYKKLFGVPPSQNLP